MQGQSTSGENETDHNTPKKSTVTKKPPSKETFEESDTPHTRKKSYKKREENYKNRHSKSNKKNSNEHVTTNLRKTEHTSSDPDLSGGYRYSINLSEVDEIQSNLLQFAISQTDEMWPF